MLRSLDPFISFLGDSEALHSNGGSFISAGVTVYPSIYSLRMPREAIRKGDLCVHKHLRRQSPFFRN